MSRLPEGIKLVPYVNRQGQFMCLIQCSPEYMKTVVQEMAAQRISELQAALKICKHTKRRNRAIKQLEIWERVKTAPPTFSELSTNE